LKKTLSCRTGVTASAIASVVTGQFDTVPVNVKASGGSFSIYKEKVVTLRQGVIAISYLIYIYCFVL
jgi:diaminopimelate epimerase